MALSPSRVFVVQRGIPLAVRDISAIRCLVTTMGRGYVRSTLQFPKEIINQLGRGYVVYQNNLRRVEELNALLLSSIGLAKLDDPPKVLFWQRNCTLDVPGIRINDELK